MATESINKHKMRKDYSALEGSERRDITGAIKDGPVDPDEQIGVTVYVRRGSRSKLPDREKEMELLLPRERKYLTDVEFNEAYGADQSDLDAVKAFAASNHLDVVPESESLAKRSVQLSGTVAALCQAFDVELHYYNYNGKTFRGRSGPINIPTILKPIVEAVLGLDNRKIGRPYFQFADSRIPSPFDEGLLPPNRYFPTDVAKLYNFPPNTDGTGECIAILAFNDFKGGYVKSSLEAYFTTVVQTQVPIIEDVVVHGRGNDPGSDDTVDIRDVTGEIMLDIQVAGAIAPGAKLVIFFTEFTEVGWVDAINAIITNSNKPSVVSISYGHREDDPGIGWTEMAIKKISEAIKAASDLGITFCCASGDDGFTDGAPNNTLAVDYPASDPFVLACGGTHLEASAGRITEETVWNKGLSRMTGGGISKIFVDPKLFVWQKGIVDESTSVPNQQPGRGVPDVAAVADKETSVVVISVNGRTLNEAGGTSVSAPVWAGLIARINQGLQARVGHLNPPLYTRFANNVLHDITEGRSAAPFPIRVGWDAYTGLGSPDGSVLLQRLISG